MCARAAPSRPAHPGLLATCCAAPVGPEMRVARMKNGPEPAEHGLHLGGCLSCRDAPPAGLRPTFTFCPLPNKIKNKTKRMRGAASNRRHSRRHSYGRVEPGTRTAPILGHRVVRVRRYPARSLKPLSPTWRQASSARDRTDPTERSRSRPRRSWRRRHAAPRNLGRTGRAFVGPPNRWGIH